MYIKGVPLCDNHGHAALDWLRNSGLSVSAIKHDALAKFLGTLASQSGLAVHSIKHQAFADTARPD